MIFDRLDGVHATMSIPEAVAAIADLLVDFPFTDDASRAHSFEALLRPSVRALINAPCPMTIFEAATPGSGKGLLANLIAVVNTGRPMPTTSLTNDEEELEKQITSLLLAAPALIMFDNVGKAYQRNLAQVLTADIWNGRRLGHSEVVTLSNTACWYMTGNNVELSDEMSRRIVAVRLDSGEEHPENRSGFRHKHLLDYVAERRSKIVSAVLSLTQRWLDAGGVHSSATLGSYERWAGIMGGILEHAGVEGFLTNREAQYESADSESAEWRVLLAEWYRGHRSDAVTANDVLGIARAHDLLMHIYAGKSLLQAQQGMGWALRRNRGRVFGKYRLRRDTTPNVQKKTTYHLELIAPKPPANGSRTLGEAPSGVNNPGETPAGSRHDSGVSGVSGVVEPTSGSVGHQIRQGASAVEQSPVPSKAGLHPAEKTPETPETPAVGTELGGGFAAQVLQNPGETPVDTRHNTGALNSGVESPLVIITEPDGTEAVLL
jgi:hypothetical protein